MITLIIAILLILIGLVGIIFPILPGTPLVYGGLLLYAIVEQPNELSSVVLSIFGGLTIAALIIDWLGRVIGARYGQASRAGGIGGLIGLILGILFTPLGGWSLIVLPPIGVLIGELLHGRDQRDAARASWWTLIGTLIPMVFNLILAGIMIGWFIAAVI